MSLRSRVIFHGQQIKDSIVSYTLENYYWQQIVEQLQIRSKYVLSGFSRAADGSMSWCNHSAPFFLHQGSTSDRIRNSDPLRM
jgi:hypothetical protein